MAKSWFDLREIHPGVWSLSEPGHLEEVISYLVLGRDRAVLVDTGMGIGDLRRAVLRLTRLPILVVNTHADFHHCGANHEYQEVAAHAAEVPRIERGWSPEEVAEAMLPHKIWAPLPAGFDPGEYRVEPSSVTRLLAEGDDIELGGRRLRVLETPGHTPGSLCLWDEHNSILFTGDTLSPTAMSAAGSDSDPEQLLESMTRLAQLAGEVARICPGHHQAPLGPDFLAEAAEAVSRVRAGVSRIEPAGEGFVRHRFRRFSLVLPGQVEEPALAVPDTRPPVPKKPAARKKGKTQSGRRPAGHAPSR
ncbi:MAG: MBL fold metallo-hydrolase [bacterium]|nr:MBL fold metallo-hydrolase [bacterium]